MKIITTVAVGMFLAIAPFAVPIVSAQTTAPIVTTTKTSAQIQATLKTQIAQLLQQVKILETKIAQMNTTQQTIKNSFIALRSQMGIGSKGSGVTLLQRFLASDPTIYPQGLVTGYYGRLTEDAVKKFQENHGISPVGEVGPQTRLLMNAFLKHSTGTLSTNFLRNTEGEQENATSHNPVVTVCRAIENSNRTISKRIPRTSLFHYVESGYGIGKECGSTVTVAPRVATGTLIVNQNDFNKTVHLSKGTRIKIEFGSEQSFDLKFTPSTLLIPVANMPTEKGVQGTYEAVGVGTATLNVTIRPICLQNGACPAYIGIATIHFDIQSNNSSAPTCTLSASPSVIHRGLLLGLKVPTLTYKTSSATSFTVNHGVGTLTPVAGGSKLLNGIPTVTTTYTGTAKNSSGTTATCDATVMVQGPITDPLPPAPICTLSVRPLITRSGLPATLSWVTTNTSSFSINNGVGTVKPTVSGSTTINPTYSTTYTGTVHGLDGKTATCSALVQTVKMPTDPLLLAPTITSMSPTSGWNNTTFVIDGTNLTAGGHPSIKVTSSSGELKGTVWFINMSFISSSRLMFRVNEMSSVLNTANNALPSGTYKITVATPKGTSNAMYFKINPYVSLAPTCTLSSRPAVVRSGQSATISWVTTNTSSFSINNGVGTVKPTVSGSTTVLPIRSTTYTGTVHGLDGKTATCSVGTSVFRVPNPYLIP